MPELEKVLDELREMTIIVEGKNDLLALRSLGIGDIIPINSRPLADIVQEISERNKEVVILTDFDEQGRKLNARLTILLQSFKVKTNRRLRNNMKCFGITRIEDLKPESEGTVSWKGMARPKI